MVGAISQGESLWDYTSSSNPGSPILSSPWCSAPALPQAPRLHPIREGAGGQRLV